MVKSVSAYRPASRWQKTSNYKIADGLTSPWGEESDQTMQMETTFPNQGGNQESGTGSIKDLPIKVRLLGVFALLAFFSIASTAVMSISLQGITGALPEGMAADKAELIRNQIANARWIGYAFASVTLLFTAAFAYIIARSIVDPVQSITQNLNALANGRTDVTLSKADSADEIGQMTSAVVAFREKSEEVRRLEQQREEERRREQQERAAQQERMANELEQVMARVVGSVQEDVQDLQTRASTMLEAHGDADKRLNNVDDATQRAQELTGSFSAAVKQLSDAIADIENRVQQATSLSNKVNRDAQSTDETIQQLVNAADQITEIIDVIRDIAKQTDILAKNAHIEAKRAGSYGRSFSVIAADIERLAQKTSDATRRVEDNVGDIRKRTDETAERVRSIIQDVTQIDTTASEISEAVDQQMQSAQQISNDVTTTEEQIKTVRDSFEVVKDVSQNAIESSRQVHETAGKVDQDTHKIREEVTNFLENAVKQT